MAVSTGITTPHSQLRQVILGFPVLLSLTRRPLRAVPRLSVDMVPLLPGGQPSRFRNDKRTLTEAHVPRLRTRPPLVVVSVKHPAPAASEPSLSQC